MTSIRILETDQTYIKLKGTIEYVVAAVDTDG